MSDDSILPILRDIQEGISTLKADVAELKIRVGNLEVALSHMKVVQAEKSVHMGR